MKPIDVQVNVQPVMAAMYHTAVYEGPCRVGTPEQLNPEAEKERAKAAFEDFVAKIEEEVSPVANVLDPVFLEYGEDFFLPDAQLTKLEPDVHEADLVLGPAQYVAMRIAHQYDKPVGVTSRLYDGEIGPLGYMVGVDTVAYLRSCGKEGYAFLDWEDVRRTLKLLQVRKAFSSTRMLVAAEGNSGLTSGVVSSIWNREDLRRRYGVDYHVVTARDLIDQMDSLSQEDEQACQELADQLIAGAEKNMMEREEILPSVRFYMAVRNALDRFDCNAFEIPCFEICAKQIPAEHHVTFCLTHSLLKDHGIPSACEGDTNVLMAQALLMYLSESSAYMGNPYVVDREDNILAIHHDVPGLKMKGLEGADVPYTIRSFTTGGWGVTVRYDFAKDIGSTVTFARFNPAGTKVLVGSGTVVGSAGVEQVGCSLAVHIRLKDIEDFFHKQMDFGHHLAMVYGDHVQSVKDLAPVMGYEVVEA